MDIGKELAKAYEDGYEQGKKDAVWHGKWIDATGALDSVRQYECSVCGKKPILNEYRCSELTKFCPFCGTKMDGD